MRGRGLLVLFGGVGVAIVLCGVVCCLGLIVGWLTFFGGLGGGFVCGLGWCFCVLGWVVVWAWGLVGLVW